MTKQGVWIPNSLQEQHIAVRAFLFLDHVENHGDGRLTLHGVTDQIVADAQTGPIRVRGRLYVSMFTMDPGTYTFHTHLATPSATVFDGPKVEFKTKTRSALSKVTGINVDVSEEGIHWIELAYEGVTLSIIPLIVMRKAPRQ